PDRPARSCRLPRSGRQHRQARPGQGHYRRNRQGIPGIPAAAAADARLIACAAIVSGVGDMRARTLIAIGLAWIAVVAAPMRTARAPEWALDQLPSGATLHKVTAEPTEYKGRKALKVELTEAATRGQPGIDFRDMPTFVLIPTTFKNGTIEVDVLGRLNG